MSIIILIAALSILISGGFLLAFLWAAGNGQFDDDYGPPRRILFDNRTKEKSKHK
ncbi:MAG TPA: cbb3-type cytochrome oxidase assembly protein CcoS [Chitinophagaceae bacterium]|nr:cbb3-type cytochrome oxidase assembly protein CcoS [Chitinophagaceae bacterium]